MTASEWRDIEEDDVLEGELLIDPGSPNRMRCCGEEDGFPIYQIILHSPGPKVRVRLPFHMDELPSPLVEVNEYHWEDSGEVGAHGQPIENPVIDNLRKRWFENVNGETHMIIEVVE